METRSIDKAIETSNGTRRGLRLVLLQTVKHRQPMKMHSAFCGLLYRQYKANSALRMHINERRWRNSRMSPLSLVRRHDRCSGAKSALPAKSSAPPVQAAIYPLILRVAAMNSRYLTAYAQPIKETDFTRQRLDPSINHCQALD